MTKAEKIQKEMREKYGAPEKVEADVIKLSQELKGSIDSNIQYSLEVDPSDTYQMTDTEKEFVKYYVNYRSIGTVATMLNMEIKEAVEIFKKYSVQQEIRRIYRALTVRQFQNKTLTISEIKSFLSSLITDDFVPEADRLKTMDKVRVAQTLIGLNDINRFAFDDPNAVVVKDFEEEVKELSTEQIKQLIDIDTSNSALIDKKDKLIEQIKMLRDVSPEEATYLKTLSIKTLLNEIDNLTKKEDTNDEHKRQ